MRWNGDREAKASREGNPLAAARKAMSQQAVAGALIHPGHEPGVVLRGLLTTRREPGNGALQAAIVFLLLSFAVHFRIPGSPPRCECLLQLDWMQHGLIRWNRMFR